MTKMGEIKQLLTHHILGPHHHGPTVGRIQEEHVCLGCGFTRRCQLTHLGSRDSYIRLLLQDVSSAFYTIILTLAHKLLLLLLGLEPSTCDWVLDLSTRRPQSVKVHAVSSSTSL